MRFFVAIALVSCVACTPSPGRASEALDWLRSYLRADTTNPPGHEERGADVLAGILAAEGIPFERVASPSGRVNLIARLVSNDAQARDLVLLHHLDVVAPGDGWTAPPFGGELRAGRVYGRGAVDAKGLGVAQLAAFIALHRAQAELRRNVVFLAVADEETGGTEGARFLLDARPALWSRAEAVLNEGGSNRAVDRKLFWWGIETAQKRALWLELKGTAQGGHGATLKPRSAVHELVQALARITERPLRYRLSPPIRAALLSQAPFQNASNRASLEAIDGWIGADGILRSAVPPGTLGLLVDTVQVTTLAAGTQINVIPTEATAKVDVRLLPDTDQAAFLRELDPLLGPFVGYRVLLDAPPATASPTDTPFFIELRDALSSRAPVAQHVSSGVTDSRFFRERGVAAYGFSPFALDAESMRGIHAADESLEVKAFDDGVATYTRLVQALAAAPEKTPRAGAHRTR
jgi:acetylornithine deacetylase/succinyl-diaminopimelate desuccinylase-like protein